MAGKKIIVAGMQIPQVPGNRDANLSIAIEAMYADPGHDIYVLPELSSSGYGLEVFTSLADVAEGLDGPSFRTFSDCAQKQNCFICYSFPRQTENGTFTITTAVVDRDGQLVAHYDKWHVCSIGDCCEKDYFAPGKDSLATFDIDGITVGLAICYDIRFPEIIRKLTVEKNISLLLHPGGWPRDDGFYTWHTFVQVRAMENSIYIMSTNWAGDENGCSAFCPPFIDGNDYRLQALGSDPGVLVGTVELDYLDNVRNEYPYLLDRVEDMY